MEDNKNNVMNEAELKELVQSTVKDFLNGEQKKKKKKWLCGFSIFLTVAVAVGGFLFVKYLDKEKEQSILDSDLSVPSETDSNSTNSNDSLFEQPMYSFGVLSDLHLQYGEDSYGGVADFQRALTYLRERVSFTCVTGDLVAWAGQGNVEYFGTNNYMEHYKECVEQYAGEMPLYECAGNHETYPSQGVSGTIDKKLWQETTGKELYYSFTHGEDVFIFLSLKTTKEDDLFPDGGLEWLESTLEDNKNKRCFVFQHCPALADRTADPSGTWSSLMEGTSGKTFIALMKKYKNTIWFHGHTHVSLGVDVVPVSDIYGYKSIHVPSLVGPRFYDKESNSLQDYYFDENGNKIWGSLLAEGYIVDVYENKIIVRGINFAAGSDREQVEEIYEDTYVLNTVIQVLR